MNVIVIRLLAYWVYIWFWKRIKITSGHWKAQCKGVLHVEVCAKILLFTISPHCRLCVHLLLYCNPKLIIERQKGNYNMACKWHSRPLGSIESNQVLTWLPVSIKVYRRQLTVFLIFKYIPKDSLWGVYNVSPFITLMSDHPAFYSAYWMQHCVIRTCLFAFRSQPGGFIYIKVYICGQSYFVCIHDIF